ncbi:MAG: hypothetical protein ABI700_10610 [Chloroflexota bacterium]
MFTLNPQSSLFVEKQRLHEIGQEIDARRLGRDVSIAASGSADDPQNRREQRTAIHIVAAIHPYTFRDALLKFLIVNPIFQRNNRPQTE